MEAQEIHRGRLIDHIQLVVRDLAASRRFYAAVFDAPNVPMGGTAEDYFWADELFVSTADSVAAQGHLTGRTHLAFQAQDRAMVDAFYKAALAHGGKDNGAPGERAKSLFQVFLESHKSLAGMGCKAQRAANSPCYWQAVQRRRPPGKALARRVGVKSGR